MNCITSESRLMAHKVIDSEVRVRQQLRYKDTDLMNYEINT